MAYVQELRNETQTAILGGCCCAPLHCLSRTRGSRNGRQGADVEGGEFQHRGGAQARRPFRAPSFPSAPPLPRASPLPSASALPPAPSLAPGSALRHLYRRWSPLRMVAPACHHHRQLLLVAPLSPLPCLVVSLVKSEAKRADIFGPFLFVHGAYPRESMGTYARGAGPL